jgi:hypothetical protein
MQTYDFHRGLMTALGAGVAGLLIWLATQVGQETTGEFWAAMGLIGAAGLVMAVSQLVGGWTKWGMPKLSAGVFLCGFLPVLVVVGWILMATQPGDGWYEGRLVNWSHDLGIFGVVYALGLWHGVLAFGFGLVLGYSFDTVPAYERDVVVDERERTMVAPPPGRAADEPVTAERTEVGQTTAPGPAVREREEVPAGRRTPPPMD